MSWLTLFFASLCSGAHQSRAELAHRAVLARPSKARQLGWGSARSASKATHSWFAVIAVACLWATPVKAQTYDVAADFSATGNPNGPWSYGWSGSLGSAFILDSDPQVREDLDTWRGDVAGDGNPAVYHNGTSYAILLGGTALYRAQDTVCS
jgi:hypothetical protein